MASANLELYARSASANIAFNGVRGDIMNVNSCSNPRENNEKYLHLVVYHINAHDDMTPAISQTMATIIVLTMMYKLSQQSIKTINVKKWIGWMQLVIDDVSNVIDSNVKLLTIDKLDKFVDYHFENMNWS